MQLYAHSLLSTRWRYVPFQRLLFSFFMCHVNILTVGSCMLIGNSHKEFVEILIHPAHWTVWTSPVATAPQLFHTDHWIIREVDLVQVQVFRSFHLHTTSSASEAAADRSRRVIQYHYYRHDVASSHSCGNNSRPTPWYMRNPHFLTLFFCFVNYLMVTFDNNWITKSHKKPF